MKKNLFVFLLILVIGVFFAYKIIVTRKIISPDYKRNETANQVGLSYSAWIPWWENDRGLLSIEKSRQSLEEVLPVWYRLDKNGLIEEINDADKQSFLLALKGTNVKIIPTIANELEGIRVSLFLKNSDWDREIENLVEIAKKNNYQGWDLDWEEIAENDKKRFSEFVNKLAESLQKEELKLSITVHAKTGKNDWEHTRGQDWAELVKSKADIRIMAYDFHYAESDPGPVTPPNELKSVISYALSIIPKEQLVLALPTYGYDWGKDKGESLQFEDAINRIKSYQGQWSYNQKNMAMKGEYYDGKQKTYPLV